MEVKIKTSTEFDAKYIDVKAEVRYWEDAEINGIDDTEEGDYIPCKNGDYWCPKINIDSGVIENWEIGKIAKVHYKVTDCCSFDILDSKGCIIFSQENDYVPKLLCPKENGYGDYIIMDISENGKIDKWDKSELINI